MNEGGSGTDDLSDQPIRTADRRSGGGEAQDRTLQLYHDLIQTNASSHLVRIARQIGIVDELRQGQRTLRNVCEARQLRPEPTELLLRALVEIGLLESYQEDFALSRAGHLLCQYDQDLGDADWSRLVGQVREPDAGRDLDIQNRYDYQAATQWVHTKAAIQAAEVLDVGGPGEVSGPRILDLGCGSAVWSCAMAHRDPGATVTAVDTAGALQAARSTAGSIGLEDRFTTIEGDPLSTPSPESAFDYVLIAQRLSCLGVDRAGPLLERAVASAARGGRVVVIDFFRGPAKPNLAECIEALRLQLSTPAGRVCSLEEVQSALHQHGLVGVQFAFLSASPLSLGLAVGEKT